MVLRTSVNIQEMLFLIADWHLRVQCFSSGRTLHLCHWMTASLGTMGALPPVSIKNEVSVGCFMKLLQRSPRKPETRWTPISAGVLSELLGPFTPSVPRRHRGPSWRNPAHKAHQDNDRPSPSAYSSPAPFKVHTCRRHPFFLSLPKQGIIKQPKSKHPAEVYA